MFCRPPFSLLRTLFVASEHGYHMMFTRPSLNGRTIYTNALGDPHSNPVTRMTTSFFNWHETSVSIHFAV